MDNRQLGLGLCQEMEATGQPNDTSPTGFWLINQPGSPIAATDLVNEWVAHGQPGKAAYADMPAQTAAMGGWNSTLVYPGAVGYMVAYIGFWFHNGTSLDNIAVIINGMGPDDIMSEQPGAPSDDAFMAAMKAAGWPQSNNDPFKNWLPATQAPLGTIEAIVQTALTPYAGVTIALPIDTTTPQYKQACADVAKLFGQ